MNLHLHPALELALPRLRRVLRLDAHERQRIAIAETGAEGERAACRRRRRPPAEPNSAPRPAAIACDVEAEVDALFLATASVGVIGFCSGFTRSSFSRFFSSISTSRRLRRTNSTFGIASAALRATAPADQRAQDAVNIADDDHGREQQGDREA